MDSLRSICTDHMKQYPLLRRGKKIAYHPTPLLPGPDLPPGHRAVTVKFPTIERERVHTNNRRAMAASGAPRSPSSPFSHLPSGHTVLLPHHLPRGGQGKKAPPSSPSMFLHSPRPITRVSRTLCDSGNSSDVRFAAGRGGGRRGRGSRGGGCCFSEGL